jgi:hypothetical protein
MFLSWRFLFRCYSKGGHRLSPHLVEVGTQPSHSFRIQPVQPTRSGLAVGDKSGVFKDFEVLGDRWPSYWELPRKFVYSDRPAREFLKDGHARCVSQRVEPGL